MIDCRFIRAARLRGVLHIFLYAWLALAAMQTARGQGIQFQPVNLADTTPGQDLWRYDFALTGLSFNLGEGFTIFFDHALFRDLRDPVTANAQWDFLAAQPDLILRQPGFVDGQASANAPSLAGRFSVNVVWLGAGEPGALPFDLRSANFQTTFQGMTTLVPEPSTAWLALAAVAIALAGRVRKTARYSGRYFGARLCAQHQPQHDTTPSVLGMRTIASTSTRAAAGPMGTAALRCVTGFAALGSLVCIRVHSWLKKCASSPRRLRESRLFRRALNFVAASFVLLATTRAQDLAPIGYEVVSSTRVGRTTFEYVIRPTITNRAGDALAVLARVSSLSTNTVLIESNLNIGNLAAASARASDGTIRLVQNRLQPFDPSALVWKFIPLPMVNVTTPARGAITNAGTILLTGSVTSGANAPIRVEGGVAPVLATADATGRFAVNVPLVTNRMNRLFVTATDETGRPGPSTAHEISQDNQAPALFIDFPADGATLYTATTDVAGRVGDMLSGFMGLSVTLNSQPSTLNSFAANVNVGIGNNGTYERTAVPLALGTNQITVTATDIAGNSTFRVLRVFRGQLPPSAPRLISISGNAQTTNVHTRLHSPITVRLVQGDGLTPIANQLVTFEVTRSDGRLLPALPSVAADVSRLTNDITRTPDGIMHLDLRTDANGQAAAWWTLGGSAGCGGDRVSVTSPGASNAVFFCASATARPASQINIGSGNNQRGEAGGPAMEPLRAWVSDSCNGVPGIPVTFRIIQGGGSLSPVAGEVTRLTSTNGDQSLLTSPATSLTVTSSITGHAAVLFTYGPDTGNNLIEATFPGNPGLPATFIAYGLARDPNTPTTFTGLVLDNASQPIGGATVELSTFNSQLSTVTDAQGQFRFALSTINPQLSTNFSGPAHLHVDGLTATNLGTTIIASNTFPGLSFLTTLIPNAENSLPGPVLLPQLNPLNARQYDGTYDLALHCNGIEGLKMTIKANSMRHPNGTVVTPATPATVSLNQVHHDNVPMPMPDGASPPFAWTLQPGGAHFDPPIQIEYPNMSGLPAGSIAYFLSFNHDTERFEIVASGHVTADSATIVTDPGAGLSIAGWGCNCPPYSVTADCKNCTTTCVSPGVLVLDGGVAGNGAEIDPGSPLVFVAPNATHQNAGIQVDCPDGPSYSRPISGTPLYSWTLIGILDTGGTTLDSGNGQVIFVPNAPPGTYQCSFRIHAEDPPGAEVSCVPAPQFVAASAVVRLGFLQLDLSGPTDTREGCTPIYRLEIRNGSGDYEVSWRSSFVFEQLLGPFAISAEAVAAGKNWLQVNVRDRVTGKLAHAYKDVMVHLEIETALTRNDVNPLAWERVPDVPNQPCDISHAPDPCPVTFSLNGSTAWTITGSFTGGIDISKLDFKLGVTVGRTTTTGWAVSRSYTMQPGETWALFQRRSIRTRTWHYKEWDCSGNLKCEGDRTVDELDSVGIDAFPINRVPNQ